jgi:hypothetical protein
MWCCVAAGSAATVEAMLHWGMLAILPELLRGAALHWSYQEFLMQLR